MVFTRRRPRKEKYANREVSAGDFIPYRCLWNDHTFVTKKGELGQVIAFDGFSFETADDDDVDMRKTIRNLLLKGMGSGSLALYFHVVRRRRSIYEDEEEESYDPYLRRKLHFEDQVDLAWRQKHKTFHAFTNEIYATVVRKADTKGAAIIEHVFKKIMQKADKRAWENDMREAYDELSESTNRLMTTLRDYGPRMLGATKTPYGLHSDLLKFLSAIVNAGFDTPIFAPRANIDRYLPSHRTFFGSRSMEVRGPLGRRFAGVVSIKEYGPSTSAGVMDGFLQMPFECIISQSFTFTNRQVAIQKMQLQQNRMIQSEDKAISQIAEITQALDMAMSGNIGFGEHHLTIMCMANSQKALENNLSMAVVELSNSGINATREKVNMEPAFWAQLPGNPEFVVRKAVVNTLNLSGFASLHNFPVGKAKDNHWGEAVTVFDTTSGTPFYFNFHVRDVGHSLIIGPTGAGKTVLMNFLCAQAMKFKGRMFFFDKDRGAEIFIRALRGVYTVISPGTGCNFNPLQLPDNSINRNFILEWLRLLVTTHDKEITTEDVKLLTSAVEGNFKLAPEDRMLRNIAPFLGIEGPGSLASRLSMWYGEGSHAKVFDNPTDALDLDKSNVFGFEMAELLQDPICLSPVLTYLFHRINISLDGTPSMIVLDEAWALIDNPVFAPKIKDWLKVLRKLNTFVIFATQSVEDASKSAISDTLIQQTATQIFLPNLKATEVYRTSFMLSEREYILIKTTDPSSRFFLVKQGTNAVVARIQLGGMDDIINVLSGRSETVILLDKIRAEVGDDPDMWLPIFLERLRKSDD